VLTEKDKAKLDEILLTMTNSSMASAESSVTQTNNKDSIDDMITINEKINLTKSQHQVLKTICDTYETSLSEYIQQALIEAMRFDIDEGNFSDALLEKIGEDNKKGYNNSPSSSPTSLASDLMKSDLDLLKKLQTEI
jgi:hypothetical protein